MDILSNNPEQLSPQLVKDFPAQAPAEAGVYLDYQKLPEWEKNLHKKLTSDNPKETAQALEQTLRLGSRAEAGLDSLLKLSNDPEKQKMIVQLLSVIGTEKSAAAIVSKFNEFDQLTQIKAIGTLGALGGNPELTYLKNLYKDPECDPVLKAPLYEMINTAELGTREDRITNFRISTLYEVTRKFGDPAKSAEILLSVADSQERRIRDSAIAALVMQASPESDKALEKFIKTASLHQAEVFLKNASLYERETLTPLIVEISKKPQAEACLLSIPYLAAANTKTAAERLSELAASEDPAVKIKALLHLPSNKLSEEDKSFLTQKMLSEDSLQSINIAEKLLPDVAAKNVLIRSLSIDENSLTGVVKLLRHEDAFTSEEKYQMAAKLLPSGNDYEKLSGAMIASRLSDNQLVKLNTEISNKNPLLYELTARIRRQEGAEILESIVSNQDIPVSLREDAARSLTHSLSSGRETAIANLRNKDLPESVLNVIRERPAIGFNDLVNEWKRHGKEATKNLIEAGLEDKTFGWKYISEQIKKDTSLGNWRAFEEELFNTIAKQSPEKFCDFLNYLLSDPEVSYRPQTLQLITDKIHPETAEIVWKIISKDYRENQMQHNLIPNYQTLLSCGIIMAALKSIPDDSQDLKVRVQSSIKNLSMFSAEGLYQAAITSSLFDRQNSFNYNLKLWEVDGWSAALHQLHKLHEEIAPKTDFIEYLSDTLRESDPFQTTNLSKFIQRAKEQKFPEALWANPKNVWKVLQASKDYNDKKQFDLNHPLTVVFMSPQDWNGGIKGGMSHIADGALKDKDDNLLLIPVTDQKQLETEILKLRQAVTEKRISLGDVIVAGHGERLNISLDNPDPQHNEIKNREKSLNIKDGIIFSPLRGLQESGAMLILASCSTATEQVWGPNMAMSIDRVLDPAGNTFNVVAPPFIAAILGYNSLTTRKKQNLKEPMIFSNHNSPENSAPSYME